MTSGGGGSWKVAYADFVTALMALFLVLWLINADQEVLGKIQEHFRNPWRAATSDGPGIIPVNEGGTDVVASQKGLQDNPAAVELTSLRRINEDLLKTFVQTPEYRDSKSLDIQTLDDGLMITFLDTPSRPFFDPDSADFTEYGKFILRTVAWELARHPGTIIELEGHTERKPTRAGDMDEWKISTDRALAGRELLVNYGLAEAQIEKVTGYGASRPLKDRRPEDPLNGRISIFIRGEAMPQREGPVVWNDPEFSFR